MKKETNCPKCEGKGTIKMYRHWMGGECFRCGGTGKVAYRKPSQPRRPDPRIAQESNRKQAKAQEIYQNDNRLSVTADHPYYYMHITQLAQKDGIWNTL